MAARKRGVTPKKAKRTARVKAAPVDVGVEHGPAPEPVDPYDGLTNRQRAFVDHYLRTWNASESARLAGYAVRQSGFENLSNPVISAAIQQRLNELKMDADEVLVRLADHARGSMGEFMIIDDEGIPRMDLQAAKERNRLHLVRKAKVTTRYVGEFKDKEVAVELELYDAQDALVHIGRAHTLFGDRNKTEGWQDEIIRLLKEGKTTAEDVINELGEDAAAPLIVAAGARPAGGS